MTEVQFTYEMDLDHPCSIYITCPICGETIEDLDLCDLYNVMRRIQKYIESGESKIYTKDSMFPDSEYLLECLACGLGISTKFKAVDRNDIKS